MGLSRQLEDGLKVAIKAQQAFSVNAFRELIGALRYAELGKNSGLSAAEELEVLSKLKRRRQESIEAFEKGNRGDLVAKEREELTVVEKFLPGPLSLEELQQLVRRAVAEVGAHGIKDMGKVMAALKDQYLGRADGKAVNAEVRSQLSELGGS